MRSHREVLAAILLLAVVASLAMGQDWTPISAPRLNWNCLASSADGRKLFAGTENWNPIYISTNFGATWTPTNSPTNDWSAVACSADGSVIVASGLVVSRDSGATWTVASSPPYGFWLACSADGKRMVAADRAVYT